MLICNVHETDITMLCVALCVFVALSVFGSRVCVHVYYVVISCPLFISKPGRLLCLGIRHGMSARAHTHTHTQSRSVACRSSVVGHEFIRDATNISHLEYKIVRYIKCLPQLLKVTRIKNAMYMICLYVTPN